MNEILSRSKTATVKRRPASVLLRGLFVIIATLSSLTSSSSSAANYHVYGAAGALYTLPASLRVGRDQWEIGLLTPNAVGIDKIFPFSEIYYSAFGLVAGFGTTPGLYGALGVRLPLFWGFQLRGELAAATLIDGFLSGEGQVGLSWEF